MKRIVLALALLLAPSFAWGQCSGVFPNNSVCGNATGSSTTPRATAATSFSAGVKVGTTPVTNGTNTYLLYNNAGILGNEQFVPLANGGLGGSQAAATVGKIPVFPGSGGAATPTSFYINVEAAPYNASTAAPDNSAAINAAFVDAAATNRKIFFPGLYTVTSKITIPLDMTNGIIECSGNGLSGIKAGAAFSGTLVDVAAGYSLLTIRDCTFDASNRASIALDLTRAESSIQNRLVNVRIVELPTGSTGLVMDGCEDSIIDHVSINHHAGATGVKDLSWHVPSGNIHIANSAMFGALFLTYQNASIIGSTVGPIVCDGTCTSLITDALYSYADTGATKANFWVNSGYFGAITLNGAYLNPNGQNNVVAFQGPYFDVVTLNGSYLDSSSNTGYTLLSSATTAQPTYSPAFYVRGYTFLGTSAIGSPGAGVMVSNGITGSGPSVLQVSPTITGSLAITGSVDSLLSVTTTTPETALFVGAATGTSPAAAAQMVLRNSDSTVGNFSSFAAFNSANGYSASWEFINVNHNATGSATANIRAVTNIAGSIAERLRIAQGLSVGTVTDPGVGAILANTTITATTGYKLGSNLTVSSTAPSIASGFCSTGSPVTTVDANNGTAAFDILIGAATCGSTGTLTMPAATTGWVCHATDVTTPASHNVVQTGTQGSTTAVVLTDYSRTAGTAQNFLAGDHIHVMCTGY